MSKSTTRQSTKKTDNIIMEMEQIANIITDVSNSFDVIQTQKLLKTSKQFDIDILKEATENVASAENMVRVFNSYYDAKIAELKTLNILYKNVNNEMKKIKNKMKDLKKKVNAQSMHMANLKTETLLSKIKI